MRSTLRMLAASALLLAAALSSRAQGPASPAPAPATASAPAASTAFDAAAATEAYLAKLTAAQRARSDSYFEGGYWLRLWNFLYGLAVAALVLGTGLSARLRDAAVRATRFLFLQGFLYWLMYLPVVTLLAFPLTVYQGFFRERQYAMMNQSFGAWLGDRGKGLALGLVIGGFAVSGLYAVARRAGRSWWVWGAMTALVFMAFGALIAPVYIAPLFNKYTKLQDPRVKEPILSMARANGIPVTDVYQVDASRQSNRVSANVSGFLGTERITLNDNLLRRCSPAEIQAVMGHEMGHYVLNHVYKGLLSFGVLIVAGFAFLSGGYAWAERRWGGRLRISGITDFAGLPLVGALLAAFFFVATPVTNSLVRSAEAEADMFGINASRQPDGMAEAALKLSEYRKLRPSELEEIVFFDHPSGYNRILAAMRWKAEHPGDVPSR
jgi:STE24 endopeptidase